ncbi:phage/plasmid primase, P4 family [Cellulosimicrobium funkei]|uniref:phage/plasmid primase, P4 family n=1 Tax=Cellulosimicrobium funkei TaxID=264251 RepID=UPI003445EB38
MTAPPILVAALELHAAGYSVLPIRADGSKAPAVTWKPYITERADEAQVRAWFDGTDHGLAVVQGAVSGRAELVELEGRAVDHLPDLAALARDTGLGDLWARLGAGWVERSPSGGFHWHYRLTDDDTVPGNTKLARRPSTPDELAEWKAAETAKAAELDESHRDRRLEKIATTTDRDVVQVLAETRGEGGYVVVAPTPGTHHPSGQPWVRLVGGPATAPVLTRDERDAFHALLRTLDAQDPAAETTASAPVAPHDPTAGITPGDDYENRTDWADLLTPHGWTLSHTHGRTRYWIRPGKKRGQGLSATTGHADDRDRLYVFTSSTEFEPEVPYTKLGALAVLEHGGDHTAAAKALRAAGFGQIATALTPAPDGPPPGGDLAGLIAPTDGATALAPQTPAAAPALHVVRDDERATEPEPRRAEPNQDNTALLFVDDHLHDVRYAAGRGRWLTWAGHRWNIDERELVREHARTLARRLPGGDGWDRYRRSALTAKGVTDVLRLAQSDQRIVVPADQLDARPYDLNTPAGIVDLRTGTLSPSDPAAMHTRSTTVAPDFDAPHPRWDKFLADTFAGDPDMIAFVARAAGMSIVGAVLDQVFFFAHGAGANGKSTFLSTLQKIVGLGAGGYSGQAPAEMLLATKNHGHPTELARLQGQRLTVTSEINEGQTFDEARIKLLTGKDTISARFMREDLFDFSPTHTLWVLSNHEPEVRVGGLAFWRRVVMVPFVHTMPEELRVKDLEERLIEDEGPAILAWVIRGAADYFARGLDAPAAVTAATKAYETEQDTVGGFVADCCVVGEPNRQDLRVRTAELRAAYERWCTDAGATPMSAKGFTLALRSKYGVRTERSASARFLAGIRLDDITNGGEDASSDASRDASPRGDLDGLLGNEDGW